MATGKPRSVRLALENKGGRGFGNTVNGLPVTTDLVYANIECDTDGLETVGDPQLSPRNDVRAQYGAIPPEPDTVWDSGARHQRRAGKITLYVPARTIGDAASGYTTYVDLPAKWLLNSSMGGDLAAAASDLVATADTATSWTVTTAGHLTVGAGLAIDMPDSGAATGGTGRKEHTYVTGKTGSVIKVSPALSRAPAVGDKIYLGQTLFAAVGMVLGPSLHIEINGDHWQTLCWGCRMESVKGVRRGGMQMLAITMSVAHSEDVVTTSNGAANPVRARGAIAHLRGSFIVLTDAIATTAPAEAARIPIPCEDVEWTIKFTLVPLSSSETMLGLSDYEVIDVSAEVDLLLSIPNANLNRDLWDVVERGLLIGWGPIGPGNGMSLYLPDAVLQIDAFQRDFSKGFVGQKLKYLSGASWVGDTGNTLPAGAPVRLFLSR